MLGPNTFFYLKPAIYISKFQTLYLIERLKHRRAPNQLGPYIVGPQALPVPGPCAYKTRLPATRANRGIISRKECDKTSPVHHQQKPKDKILPVYDRTTNLWTNR